IDWKTGVFVTLPKKGDLKECANHRMISLINHTSKILLYYKKDGNQVGRSVEQADFKTGRGTRDQTINLRLIIEKCKGYKVPLYMYFIDYSKEFDRMIHGSLWKTLKEMASPNHVIELIRQLYKNQNTAFKIAKGVRQGYVMSPHLFTIHAEAIMKEALGGFKDGAKIGSRRITNLRYTDDINLISSTQEDLKDLLKRVQQASKRKGLQLNMKKTKIMDDNNKRFEIDGNKIEEVKSFNYLGSVI
uniref:ribonuclease H n=1 Tax=Latimeria chalumnae TaxID=7897 RepID=H3AVM1_LATCH